MITNLFSQWWACLAVIMWIYSLKQKAPHFLKVLHLAKLYYVFKTQTLCGRFTASGYIQALWIHFLLTYYALCFHLNCPRVLTSSSINSKVKSSNSHLASIWKRCRNNSSWGKLCDAVKLSNQHPFQNSGGTGMVLHSVFQKIIKGKKKKLQEQLAPSKAEIQQATQHCLKMKKNVIWLCPSSWAHVSGTLKASYSPAPMVFRIFSSQTITSIGLLWLRISQAGAAHW